MMDSVLSVSSVAGILQWPLDVGDEQPLELRYHRPSSVNHVIIASANDMLDQLGLRCDRGDPNHRTQTETGGQFSRMDAQFPNPLIQAVRRRQMIVLQRTTRDSAAIVFPTLVVFTVALTYLALAVHGLAPIWVTVFTDAYWLTPIIAVILWLLLFRYTYQLFYPSVFRTEVSTDRIVFSNSAKLDQLLVLKRSDIRRFYIKPRRWWHNENATYPIVYETIWNESQAISLDYVYDGTAGRFLQAIREEWGQEYVPVPKPPDLLLRRIRLWPRRSVDESSVATKPPS